MISKLKYRIWQFWQSLGSTPDQSEWHRVDEVLTRAEMELFIQLPVPDQNHSLRVLKNLTLNGESDSALLKAGLLHDLGKLKYPLRLWERVFAVLMMRLFPTLYQKWGEGDPDGPGRALVVNRHHPDWGADLAADAGSDRTTVWLIRNHEKQSPSDSDSNQDLLLLSKLQVADNQN